MCLVTFVPLSDDHFAITSNRDEAVGRKPPVMHQSAVNEKTLFFPKDEKGGTWIGHDNLKNTIILLNGGNTNHQRRLPYRKSRGLIVIELLESRDITAAWANINLENIEPFTIVFFSAQKTLWEWIWTGQEKQATSLDHAIPHCWNSTTLYTRKENEICFQALKTILSNQKTTDGILQYHLERRYENKPFDPIYPFIKTVSNTMIHISPKNISLAYKNLR